jgi:hypothetical protein
MKETQEAGDADTPGKSTMVRLIGVMTNASHQFGRFIFITKFDD